MSKLIENFANVMVNNHTIKAEDKELYVYGLNQGLFMLLNIAMAVILGILFGMWWQSIVFLLCYSPLRSFAGGAHAKSHLRCFLYSSLLIASVLFLLLTIPVNNVLCVLIATGAGVTIFALAPVEDENKPLDDLEIKVYRKRARIILLVEYILLIIFILVGQLTIASCVAISLSAMAVMLIVGKIKNSRIKPQQA